MVWLKQSPVIIEITVIRLMLSQEPGKGTVFLQDQQGISPAFPHHAALLCSRDVLTDMPASRNLAASRAAQQMASAELQPSRGASQTGETTMEMSHGKPLSYTINHSHATTEHYPGCSTPAPCCGCSHGSSLLGLWYISAPVLFAKSLWFTQTAIPKTSSPSLPLALQQGRGKHLGKVQVRQEMFVLQLQR